MSLCNECTVKNTGRERTMYRSLRCQDCGKDITQVRRGGMS